MSKPKHTPGPWSVEIDKKYPRLEVIRLSNGEEFDDCPTLGETEKRANLRLAAAAPEMLEALKSLIENIGNVGAHVCPGFDCNRCQSPDVGWAAAHDAIAKAEGRE